MIKTSARRRSLLLLAALVACTGAVTLSACDDNDGVSGDIAIEFTPTSLDIIQGGSGTTDLTLERGGDFTGDVEVEVSGEPAGMDVDLVPGFFEGPGVSEIAVTVSAAEDTPVGTYTLTFTAEGDGVSDDSATLTVEVVAPPPVARQ